MGLFGNKREKCEKVDKYEHHSSKGGRSGYGPPALPGTPPSSYFPGGGAYFDGFGQVAPQGKMSKYDKYGGPGKNFFGGDPMQQAMMLPPNSPAAMQAQAAAMYQMQQYMQGPGANAQFGGILPPIQMPLNAAQQAGLLPPQQQYFGFGGQQQGTPFFDPSNPAFQQQQQQQPGAFAPYQQPNFYDPASAGAFTGPYGYMPAAF